MRPRVDSTAVALSWLVAFAATACSPSVPSAGSVPRSAIDREFLELAASYDRETGARQISVGELEALLRGGKRVVLLDIRQPDEHAVSMLPGARRVPPAKVGELELEPPGDATVVTYCTAGYRSGKAAVELEKRLGRAVYNLHGGIIAWFNGGGEVRDPEGRPVDRIHPYGEEWSRFVRTRAPPGKNEEKTGQR